MDVSAINNIGVGYTQNVGRLQQSGTSSPMGRASEPYPAAILNINGEEADDELGIYSREDILENNKDQNGNSLTASEKQMVKDLATRDGEVRRHETAHAALLGQYAVGGPTYTYQIGPDGKSYAVGGSIAADTGSESTPEATIAKARIIGQAAGGVDDASAADSAAMVGAYQMAAEASISMMA